MKRIESVKNQKVKDWKKLHTKKGRSQSGTFLIEGFHLVEVALNQDIEISEIILREGDEFPFKLDTKDIPLYEVTNEIFRLISDTETPQGIAAVCTIPSFKENKYSTGRFLLIDRVQDPGNLGTMIRTADSAGLDAVVLGEGCADVYNSKVIRSTQGSIFHLPILNANLTDWLKVLNEENIPVYGTALENGSPYKEVSPKESFALILGNEGQGVNSELLKQTTKNLYIPIYGQAESLNVSVAAGILIYHLRG